MNKSKLTQVVCRYCGQIFSNKDIFNEHLIYRCKGHAGTRRVLHLFDQALYNQNEERNCL